MNGIWRTRNTIMYESTSGTGTILILNNTGLVNVLQVMVASSTCSILNLRLPITEHINGPTITVQYIEISQVKT